MVLLKKKNSSWSSLMNYSMVLLLICHCLGMSGQMYQCFWSKTVLDTTINLIMLDCVFCLSLISSVMFFRKEKVVIKKFDPTRVRNLILFFIVMIMMAHILSLYSIVERFFIPLPTWIRFFGVIVTILGFILRTWSQFALNLNWSEKIRIRHNHELIQVGPYEYVRHPMYSSYIFFTIGLFFATTNWLLGILGLFYTLISILRIPAEEKVLTSVFPNYSEYRKTTGAIFPKI